MAALFSPVADAMLRGFVLAAALGGLALVVVLMLYVRTPYNSSEAYAVEQPIAFDHRHHVRDDGIECRYCHTTVERSPTAGIPSTGLCMGCHAQIWLGSAKLAPIRASFFRNTPLVWNRVNDLPDFVFFNHSVHVRAGVECAHCHGDVASMPVVYKTQSFTMGFCLDCHRNPERRVPGYHRKPSAMPDPGNDLLARTGAPIVTDPLLTCTACHR